MNFVKLYIFFLLFAHQACADNCSTRYLKTANEQPESNLKDLKIRSLRYFQDNTHPESGLTLDRAPAFEENNPNNRMASLAATGFSLTVLADGVTNGMIPKADAKKIIEKAITGASRMENYHGWLPHFVDWETGKRIPHVEYSTVDTSLFLAGALYAVQKLPNPKLERIVKNLLNRLNYKVMLTNKGSDPSKKTLSMGFEPEKNTFTMANWDTYAEHSLLYFLGFGLEKLSKQLPQVVWDSWKRQKIRVDGQDFAGADLPLFAHQYPFLWLDPKHSEGFGFKPLDNARLATKRDKELSEKDPRLGPYGIWGLSASDGPKGYSAFRFGDGGKDPGDNDGTVCPGCAAASIAFSPDLVIPYIDFLLHSQFKDKIYGKYGFVDAFNPSQNWYATDSLGITVGSVYLSIVNHESGSIWKEFEKVPEIRRARRNLQGY